MDAPFLRRITADETIDLRHRVMWPDRPRAAMILGDDAQGLHFGAEVAGAIVGVGSFFPDGADVRLRKLAVDPDFQGRGIARALIDHALPELEVLGLTRLWCDARVTAKGFYQAAGFTLDDRVFVKNGLDYVVAERAIGAA